MQIPVQITFRGVRRSKSIEDLITERAGELEKFHRRITGCHVVVEATRRRGANGLTYLVRVDLVVPGGELIANRGHRARAQHYEIAPAIEQAFRVAGRRLEDFVRRVRGSVKQHREISIARISKVFPAKSSGFIATPAGREIYFHENAVRGGAFEKLAVGDPVHYVEEQGDEGPNAAMIKRIVKPAAIAPRSRRQVRARRKLARTD